METNYQTLPIQNQPPPPGNLIYYQPNYQQIQQGQPIYQPIPAQQQMYQFYIFPSSKLPDSHLSARKYSKLGREQNEKILINVLSTIHFQFRLHLFNLIQVFAYLLDFLYIDEDELYWMYIGLLQINFRMLPVIFYFGLFSYLIFRLKYKWLKWFSISFLVYSGMLAVFCFTEFIIAIKEEFEDEDQFFIFAMSVKFLVFNAIQLWLLNQMKKLYDLKALRS